MCLWKKWPQNAKRCILKAMKINLTDWCQKLSSHIHSDFPGADIVCSVQHEPDTEWFPIPPPPEWSGPAVDAAQTLQISVAEVRQGIGRRARISRKINVHELNQLAPSISHPATFGAEIVEALRQKIPKDEPFILFYHC